jgi:dTDP-glucose pyrophosphorylase
MDERFKQCQVAASGTLLDALRAVDRGAAGIALVVDGTERLVGVLTDGDIRRALLRGVRLESSLAPHLRGKFTSVPATVARAEVIDLMQALRLDQIPVLDPEGKLVGLHLIHEMLGVVSRPNEAVVMAGGKGTRLTPITETVPKPMVRVAGRPILERIVLHLVGFGIRKVYLSVNYLGKVIEDHFGDGSTFGCRIEYLREDRPLGTGGALSLLPAPPRHPLLVMNGDLVTQADLGAMLEFHDRGKHRATVGVRPYVHTVPYGCLEIEEGKVRRITEKPRLVQVVNAGIYILEPEIVARVPRGQEYPITDLLEDCLARGESVGPFEIADEWIDVGRHDDLRQAKEGKPRGDGL